MSSIKVFHKDKKIIRLGYQTSYTLASEQYPFDDNLSIDVIYTILLIPMVSTYGK